MPKNIDELKELVKNNDGYKFRIKVVANSKINLIDFTDEYIKVKIMARAVEGKANKAIVEFLSDIFTFCNKSLRGSISLRFACFLGLGY